MKHIKITLGISFFLYYHFLQKLKVTVIFFGRIIFYQAPQSMSVLMVIHPGFFLSIYRQVGCQL